MTATIGVAIGIGIERKREQCPGGETDAVCCGVVAGKGQQETIPIPIAIPIPTVLCSSASIHSIRGSSRLRERFYFPH
ncbi:MAG TPA: hypothetical protein VMS21_01010, partial [Methylomirabilota bacterium]|nr:hypothetical protein [Methylomirabilota bacterium]